MFEGLIQLPLWSLEANLTLPAGSHVCFFANTPEVACGKMHNKALKNSCCDLWVRALMELPKISFSCLTPSRDNSFILSVGVFSASTLTHHMMQIQKLICRRPPTMWFYPYSSVPPTFHTYLWMLLLNNSRRFSPILTWGIDLSAFWSHDTWETVVLMGYHIQLIWRCRDAVAAVCCSVDKMRSNKHLLKWRFYGANTSEHKASRWQQDR